MHTLVH